ncbi:MAG: hypothetical protein JWM05_1614 [Acidimicrobiales bacterium]|nr:hypothetical protein [Acidimicrobiales bacterium]
MDLKPKLGSKRRIRTSIAAAVAVVAVSIGGYAIAGASSSPSGTTAASASTASATSPSTTTAGTSSAGKVIPFTPGQPGASKTVGQIPASYKAGTGTIVTGTAADKAKAAAVAAYPGGTVNRVVLLSNGDYNVHIIGVNWPHHVFVSSAFKVLGAQ